MLQEEGQVQNGWSGGVNHDVNQPKKEALKVIKVEGLV